MDRRILIVAAVAAIAVGGWFAWDFFGPKGTTRVNDDLDRSDPSLVVLASGAFTGADSVHRVSGQVTLYASSDGPFLRFEDYDATSGPDVYFYLSTDPAGDYDAGQVMRVPVDRGAEDGQATLRGTFNVRLPAGAGTNWSSIIVWCDDFDVKFGHASIR